MSDFLYKVDVLSENRPAMFKELTNNVYKNFVKVIVNEDKDILELTINGIIQKLCGDLNYRCLTCIDKLYIMMVLRAYNVSPSITFVCDTDETSDDGKSIKINCNIDIIEVLQELEKQPITHKFEVKDDKIHVQGSLPKCIYYESTDQLIADCIDVIRFNDKTIPLFDLTVDQKVHIVDSLPSFVLPEVYKFVTAQDEVLKQTPLITINTDRNIGTDKNIFASLVNGSIGEIIKLFYRVSLKDFYVNEYNLIKKFKFTYQHLQNITPAELNLYIDVIKEDMDRERKEREKEQKETDQQYLPPSIEKGDGIGM